MIVLDANILIRAVLGRRVRELIDTYAAQGVRFFAPDVAFADAEKYLPPLLKKRGKPDDLSGALGYLRELIEPIGPDVYFVFESEARLRLRGRDETDWPTPAAATNGCFDPGKGTDGCYQVKLKATTCAAIIMSRLPISCPRVPTVA